MVMTPRQRCERIVWEIASKYGVSYAEMRSHQRRKTLGYARIEAARALSAIGYNAPRIARMFHKHHTTIYLYLGRLARRIPYQTKGE